MIIKMAHFIIHDGLQQIEGYHSEKYTAKSV
jgi:hypothetical protein